MKLSIQAGSTSQSINVFIQDSTSTTGAGKTGLVFNTASLTAYYSFTGANATATSITLATLATVTTAYSSGGFKELDATNMPGWYRLDLPNAALATAKGRSVSIHLRGATGMADCPVEIELTGWDNQDSVRGGLTALPNAAAAASGGLITAGTGTNQISLSSGGVDLQTIKTQAVTAAAGVTFPSSIASPTNITAATGIVLSGVTHTGAVIPTVTTVTNQLTAAAIATGVWQDTTAGDFTVASSIGKSLFTSGAVPGAAGGLFIAGTNAATTVTTSFTTTFTGNLTGSVGSVTGNVGGNVVGSVASVTARVTANTDQLAGQTVTAAAGVTFPSSVASPTNITAATGVTLASGTHTGAVIPTVTTVTNQLTAAQVATGVWQDTTAGDFTVALSIGKSLFTSGAVPGAAGGLFIAGTNAATTITTALTTTFTGNLTGSVGSVTGAVGSVTGAVGSVTGLTNATIATAVWTDTTAGDFTTLTSPGKIIFAQLGGAFTTTSSSVFSTAALANAPTGGSAPTAAQVATAVWQDTTAGDFTVAGSIGKSLFTSGVVPGAAGGLFIAGTNAATTITTALTTTFTGNLTGSVGSVTARVTANTDQLAGQTVTAAAGVTFPSSVASPTNITAATGVTLASGTHTGAVIPTVTTVTNQLTAAAIATGVWQDATSGDFTVASSIGKSLYTAGVVPGGSGGLLISGSNSGTTTLAALTVSGATTLTGNVSMAAGLTVTQSTLNASAISITGNGTGHGISVTSGSGATGNGINATSSATNGNGVSFAGSGTGSGERVAGGATGAAVAWVGGATSGAGLSVTTTSGDGLSITPTAGNAILATANGTSKHGFVITGGTAGTSDGLKAVAGTGGVPIRGDITGNITGTVTTVTTVTNQLTAAQIATGVWQDTTAGDFTVASSIGKSLYTAGVVPGGSGGLFIAGTNAATTVTTSFTTTFTGNLTGSVGSVTARVTANTDQLAGQTVTAAAGVTFPSSVASPTNITAATGVVLSGVTHTGAVIPTVTTVTTATNLTNAPTSGDFTATMKTSIGTAVAASAVASVTGNVGGNVVGSVASVTGNVGGNVTGSVGSVVAAVIKKNTALANFEFMMTDSTNHAPATGKTVTCTRSIDGSSFAAGTLANIAEVAFGIYRVDFGAGDLNGNIITLRATATGSDDTFITITTNP